jgi:hypothetical protein
MDMKLTCLLIVILQVLYPSSLFSQNWQDLKSEVKNDAERSQRNIQNVKIIYLRKFSDQRNQFLMRDVYPSGKPIYLTTFNSNAASTTGAASLQNGNPGFILNGNQQHIFQWDGGAVLSSHNEFGNRIESNEGSEISLHATHVAGTLIASGIIPQAKGMAPQALLHAYTYDNDIAEITLQSESNTYGYMISNHSYGTVTGWYRVNNSWQWAGDETVSKNEDYTAGFYSSRTRQLDQISYLSPYHAIVWAAGNDRSETGDGTHPPDCNGGTGFDCIAQEATAKNTITVGAVGSVANYSGSASVIMSSFSSWGPTDDGRIKPDVVSNGMNLFSTGNGASDQYTILSGTSMATPSVSGSLSLLQELYKKINQKPMRASTLKALTIHTAREAGVSDGPDYSYGWGLVNVAEAASLISKEDKVNVFILEGKLANDQTHTWQLNPMPNQKITATLVWTDPAGIPPFPELDPVQKMLVNDLDIRIIDPGNGIQYPWILSRANPTNPATRGDNSTDNVEKIEFDFPENQTYDLTVSHKGSLVNEFQNYSLIITYTSTDPSKTLYWIGGSGNWDDPSHWSLTSGGISANVVPSSIDRVIVDENSLPLNGSIELSSPVTCNSLRWYCSKSSSIKFNGHPITVTHELVSLGAIDGDGKFTLNAEESGILNAYGRTRKIDFSNGDWSVYNSFFSDSIKISNGSVKLIGRELSTNHFDGQSPNTKLDLGSSRFVVYKSWRSDVSKISIETDQATLLVGGSMQAIGLDLKGTLEVYGSIKLMTDLICDRFILENSALTQENGTKLTMRVGMNVGSATINSTGTSFLETQFREKVCLQNVLVSNISHLGQALLIVDGNGTITNTQGITQQLCDQAIFPDFTARYNCAGSFTNFTSTSSGMIEQYHWDFGDVNSLMNTSTLRDPVHQYTQEGVYQVTLTISGGGVSRSYQQEIQIMPNTLPESFIEYGGTLLVCSASANSYQWFLNGELQNEFIGKTYPHRGENGLYQVVLYDNQCNRESNEFTFVGLPEEQQITIFPNPASEKIYIDGTSFDTIHIVDCMGRSHIVLHNIGAGWIDVSSLESGLYFVFLTNGSEKAVQKILISR